MGTLAAATPPSAAATMPPVAQHLTRILADTYSLGVKTHGAHWNARGGSFFGLHAAFEEQYREMISAADEIAERIRALGHPAPGSLRRLLELSSINEPPSGTVLELVASLRDDHRQLSESAEKAWVAAQDAGDEATADLMIARISQHDKVAWMLSSFLDE